MSYSRYAKDPYWLTARFKSKCASESCGAEIPRGAKIFYYPRGKKAYCKECGTPMSREFESADADEAAYNSCY